MMKPYLLLLTAFLLSSCVSHKTEVKRYSLKHEIVGFQPEDVIGQPFQLAMADGYLILADGATEKAFHLFDMDGERYVGDFGIYGQGPGELLSAQSLVNVNGKLFFFDTGKNKVFEILLSGDASNIDFAERGSGFAQSHSYVLPVESGLFATCGIYEEGWVKLFDAQENEVSSSEDCPQYEADGSLSNLIRSFAYQGLLAYDGGDRLVMATCQANQLYVYKLEDGNLKCTSSLVESYPKYRDDSSTLQKDTNREAYGISLDKTNKMGYIGLYAASNGFYALYSGSSVKEQVDAGRGIMEGSELVFYDYDLNELASYRLDVPLKTFTIDPRTNTVYGFSDLPEATLVKFKLP